MALNPVDSGLPENDAGADARAPGVDASATDGATARDAAADVTITAPPDPDDASVDGPTNPPQLDAGNDGAPTFPDAEADGGIVWTGPPPDPGMASCEIYNPAIGGGCICETVKNGHLYSMTCQNDLEQCVCAIDEVTTTQIANLCESVPDSFEQACGF